MVNLPSHLSDEQLVDAVKRLAADERTTAAALVAHLAEMDSRRLATAAGFSLFQYCCEVLLLSEDAACNRTTAVRMVRRFPAVLPMLADGRVNLSTLRLLAPHLTADNHDALLAEATGRSKREVEILVARRFPQTVVTSIRRMAASQSVAADAAGSPGQPAVAPARIFVAAGQAAAPAPPPDVPQSAAAGATRDEKTTPGVPSAAPSVAPEATPASTRPLRRAVTPMAEDVFLIRLAANGEMVGRLRRAQDLLSHAVPRGDVTEIFDRALIALIEELEKRRFGRPGLVRARVGGHHGVAHQATPSLSRYIPVDVRRAVWTRDNGSCAYASSDGRRCGETRFIEFHHVRPHEVGGEPTVANIALRCRAHNQYEADVYFGPIRDAMATVAGADAAT